MTHKCVSNPTTTKSVNLDQHVGWGIFGGVLFSLRLFICSSCHLGFACWFIPTVLFFLLFFLFWKWRTESYFLLIGMPIRQRFSAWKVALLEPSTEAMKLWLSFAQRYHILFGLYAFLERKHFEINRIFSSSVFRHTLVHVFFPLLTVVFLGCWPFRTYFFT